MFASRLYPTLLQLLSLALVGTTLLACSRFDDKALTANRDGLALADIASANPQRVIIIGPATTETLFAMGLGERVVGVSDYCDWQAAEHLQRVGGLLNPNLEQIAALQPDLLIVEGQSHILRELAKTQGFRLENASIASRELWVQQVEHLGQLFKSPAAAHQLLAEVNGELRRIERRNRPENDHDRPKVLIVINRDFDQAAKMLVAGVGSFLSELVKIAGAVNLFEDNARGVFDLNTESLVRNPPDIILEFDLEKKTQGGRATTRPVHPPQANSIWTRDWPNLPAVANRRILTLSGRENLVPGPRMAGTAKRLAQIFSTQAQVSPTIGR